MEPLDGLRRGAAADPGRVADGDGSAPQRRMMFGSSPHSVAEFPPRSMHAGDFMVYVSTIAPHKLS